MIKSLILPIAAVAAFIVIVGLLVQNSGSLKIPGIAIPTTSTLSQKSLTIGTKSINVEVADTEPERQLGLGNRSYLDPNTGMLFVFDSKNVIPSFWMRGMQIPLDIIWISDGKVVKIDKNISPPAANTPDSKLPVYNPGQPVDYVLEVNAGFSDQNNITTGTQVNLSGI